MSKLLTKLYILVSYVVPGVLLGVFELRKYNGGPTTLESWSILLPPFLLALINARVSKEVGNAIAEYPELIFNHAINFLYFSIALFLPLHRAISANPGKYPDR